ncbi:nuclear transport factor 2 family protein [Shewanella sp. AS1]|uniref:nuclear transport factor 2 family protein n=1 Tax=Shewanella sp. AS1 TaxID=2907626 RepID=UPI001F476ED0|nr:nuclear transport factor 2 family protein [Shewanella sp. AS1]MCE9680305.1 nuclear transport factor 2 family protein [Shewanella sp. AS1]
MKPLLLAGAMALFSLSAQAESQSSSVVRQFIADYNQHSVEAMLQNLTEDVRWMHINGDKVEVETSGKAQFGAAMTDYFATLEQPQADIIEMIASDAYVSIVERVKWQADGEHLSQCSIGNFRIQDGKIAEFWYLPAHSCDTDAEAKLESEQ